MGDGNAIRKGILPKMIYLDPTEARDNTRMPQGIIDSAKLLEGLETMTGADFLITPKSAPLIESLGDSVPQRLRLSKAIEMGLLGQRVYD